MKINSTNVLGLTLAALLALPAAATAQELDEYGGAEQIDVYGTIPADLSDMEDGPDLDGIISARDGNRIMVLQEDGTRTPVSLSAGTKIRERGGFLDLGRSQKSDAALMNGLPVDIETVRWSDGLIASKISFKDEDLEIASMISNGTAQGFAEQTAATEALRGRVGSIDQYNIRGTTNVYFDTGKWNLTPAAQADLCRAAEQAGSTENALLLVVGYTDSVGDQDYNQTLSERRAGRVVNFLQQECEWQPWRMLTPTGMAEADPTADNSTEAGRAENRRVAVNILVSKAVDGI